MKMRHKSPCNPQQLEDDSNSQNEYVEEEYEDDGEIYEADEDDNESENEYVEEDYDKVEDQNKSENEYVEEELDGGEDETN